MIAVQNGDTLLALHLHRVSYLLEMYDAVVEDNSIYGLPFGSAFEARECSLEAGSVEAGDGLFFGSWLSDECDTALLKFYLKA